MKLIWSRSALSDRLAIYKRIAQINPGAAIKLDSIFSSRASLLLTHPNMGRVGRIDGTRELVVHSNYLLVYCCKLDQIQILRVQHVAQLWP